MPASSQHSFDRSFCDWSGRYEIACGPSDKKSLQQIATQFADGVVLLTTFDAFRYRQDSHLFTQPCHQANQIALRGRPLDVAYQFHIELHNVGPDECERVQSCITCAEVVDCHAISQT